MIYGHQAVLAPWLAAATWAADVRSGGRQGSWAPAWGLQRTRSGLRDVLGHTEKQTHHRPSHSNSDSHGK